MKYKYNGEFKNIDTEEKAYFLGWMYSDGNVYGNTINGYTVKLKISDKDEEIIEKLIDEFPFFKFYEEKLMYTYKGKTELKIYSGMRAYRKEIYNDLLSHGVLPGKSTYNKNNFKMPKLKDNLIPHFIRGLADGDGSYSWCRTDNRLYLNVVIIDASKVFMDELALWFNNQNLICKVENDKSYFRIRFRQSKLIKLYKKLIYDNATIYMQRKYNKIKNYSGSIPLPGPIKTT